MMIYSIFTVMPVFVILFWLLLFFLRSKKNNATQQFLMLFLGVAFVNYIAHWCYFNHNYELYQVLDSVWVFTSLASYPLYFYYIRLLTVDTRIQCRWSWILLPALLLSLFSASIYLLISPAEVEQFIHEVLFHDREQRVGYSPLIRLQQLRIGLFKFMFGIQVLFTLLFGLRLIADFNKKVYAFYSNAENREMTKIRHLLFFLVLASLVSALSNLIGKNYFYDHPYLLAFPSIMHSIALFGISYVGYNQHFTIQDLQQDVEAGKPDADESDNVDPASENMTGSCMTYFFSSLKSCSRLTSYSKSRCSNERCGKEARYQPHLCFRLINCHMKMSFCDYVNDYRIRHAEQLLSSPEQTALSMEDVAISSGFSGNSSFYRAFVKKHGISGKYRKFISQAMKTRFLLIQEGLNSPIPSPALLRDGRT